MHGSGPAFYIIALSLPGGLPGVAHLSLWEEVGGQTFLPGTNRASDRFVRATYYMETVKKPEDPNEALATALSVIRSASVPVGIATPGQPNIASTQWRTMADQRNMMCRVRVQPLPVLGGSQQN